MILAISQMLLHVVEKPNVLLWNVLSDVLIAYISRGLLSSLMEPKEVMTVISNENRRTPLSVIINTYAVIDGKFSSLFFSILQWLDIISNTECFNRHLRTFFSKLFDQLFHFLIFILLVGESWGKKLAAILKVLVGHQMQHNDKMMQMGVLCFLWQVFLVIGAGTGRAKLLGEQLVHPGPLIFSITYS